MVLTDGESSEEERTIVEAKKLREANVAVFAIGLGSGAALDEVKAIASKPSKDHAFMLDEIVDIEEFASKMSALSCNEPGAINPGETVIVDIEQGDFRHDQTTPRTASHPDHRRNPPC